MAGWNPEEMVMKEERDGESGKSEGQQGLENCMRRSAEEID